MNKAAKKYHSQGLELLNAGRLEAAVNFFTQAIDEDHDFLEAYKDRGETLIKLNRVDEGKKDLQKAEGTKKKPATTVKKGKKVVEKYNLQGVDDLWGDVLSEESSDDDDDLFLDNLLDDEGYSEEPFEGEEPLESDEGHYGTDDLLYDDMYSVLASETEEVVDQGDEHPEPEEGVDLGAEQSAPEDLLYDDTFSAIALETEEKTFVDEAESDEARHDEIALQSQPQEQPVAEEVEPIPAGTEICTAVLEYIGGMRQEVPQAKLFEPLENSLLIIDEEENDEQVVFFDQLTCLQISDLPPRLSAKRRESCLPEIIETTDGKVYHELVHPEQELDSLLICFSQDEQTPCPVTLLSKAIIKKRTLDKPLTDILLEKRFISKVMLNRALQEYAHVKSLTLEKIIAQKTRVRLEEIEDALNQNQMQGLQKEELLLISGLANEEQILDAVDQLENIQKLKVGQFLIEKRMVREGEVYSSLAEKHKIPFLNLKGRKISKKTLASLPERMIVEHEILPLGMKDETLLVATHFINMEHLSDKIAQTAGCKQVKYALSPPGQIRKIIHMLYGRK